MKNNSEIKNLVQSIFLYKNYIKDQGEYIYPDNEKHYIEKVSESLNTIIRDEIKKYLKEQSDGK